MHNITWLTALLFSLSSVNTYGEHKITITVFSQEKVKRTSHDIEKVRLSFIDFSKKKKIGIREINLQGETTNYITLPSNLLEHDSKNYRWGAALQYNVEKQTYYIGLWKKGLYELSRSGEILSHFKTDNITHSIEILPNGNLLFPYSWSSKDENQITEITPDGKIVWSWSAQKFIEKNNFSMTVSNREPENYVAATGATLLNSDTIIATLSQANVIAFIDKRTGKVKSFQKDTRPHVPIVKDGKFIGYTYRRSNGAKLWDFECDCFKLVSIIDEDAESPKGRSGWSRSLSLQYLGENQWFISGITSLRQITTSGEEIWRASISPNPQWKGFHKVIRYEVK